MPGAIKPSAGALRDAVRTSGGDLWATVQNFVGKCHKSGDLRWATVGLSPDDRTEIERCV